MGHSFRPFSNRWYHPLISVFYFREVGRGWRALPNGWRNRFPASLSGSFWPEPYSKDAPEWTKAYQMIKAQLRVGSFDMLNRLNQVAWLENSGIQAYPRQTQGYKFFCRWRSLLEPQADGHQILYQTIMFVFVCHAVMICIILVYIKTCPKTFLYINIYDVYWCLMLSFLSSPHTVQTQLMQIHANTVRM